MMKCERRASGIISESLRKILRLVTLLRMTRSKMGRMFKVSQARAGIQVLLRNKVTIAGVQAYVLL